MDTVSQLKQQAARAAVDVLVSGLIIGLGSGSTALHAVHAVARRLQDGQLRDLRGVPTSEETARVARELGIPLVSLDEAPRVDVTIDGADEIDPRLNLIKGLGGALLREKVVAAASRRLIIVADAGKRVDRLGSRAPVPVEVIGFARAPVQAALAALGAAVTMRTMADMQAGGDAAAPFVTDEGNLILDCRFPPIADADADALAAAIRRQPGVVEHGLFLGLATTAVVAGPDGIAVLGEPLGQVRDAAA